MTDDDRAVANLRAAIADLEATARDLDPGEPEDDRRPEEDSDALEPVRARLRDDGDAEPDDDPVRAGLATLVELHDERETSNGPEVTLDAASARVVDLEDQVRTLAELFSAYGRDTARPETEAAVEPMTTPPEPDAAIEAVADERSARQLTRRRMARLVAVLVASAVAAPVLTGLAPVQLYAVATGSMAPDIPQGSLVWTEQAPPEVGDVIVYESHLGRPTVHRVTDVRTVDGTTHYRTQGDANPSPDAFSVPQERVHGVVTGSVPMLGNLWMIDLAVQAAAFAALVAGYVGLTVASDEELVARIRGTGSGAAEAEVEASAV